MGHCFFLNSTGDKGNFKRDDVRHGNFLKSTCDIRTPSRAPRGSLTFFYLFPSSTPAISPETLRNDPTKATVKANVILRKIEFIIQTQLEGVGREIWREKIGLSRRSKRRRVGWEFCNIRMKLWFEPEPKYNLEDFCGFKSINPPAILFYVHRIF